MVPRRTGGTGPPAIPRWLLPPRRTAGLSRAASRAHCRTGASVPQEERGGMFWAARAQLRLPSRVRPSAPYLSFLVRLRRTRNLVSTSGSASIASVVFPTQPAPDHRLLWCKCPGVGLGAKRCKAVRGGYKGNPGGVRLHTLRRNERHEHRKQVLPVAPTYRGAIESLDERSSIGQGSALFRLADVRSGGYASNECTGANAAARRRWSARPAECSA